MLCVRNKIHRLIPLSAISFAIFDRNSTTRQVFVAFFSLDIFFLSVISYQFFVCVSLGPKRSNHELNSIVIVADLLLLLSDLNDWMCSISMWRLYHHFSVLKFQVPSGNSIGCLQVETTATMSTTTTTIMTRQRMPENRKKNKKKKKYKKRRTNSNKLRVENRKPHLS